MQIKPTQLRNHLKTQQLPIYMVCGDEPLQHREALDMLRKATHYYGYKERDVFIADAHFKWSRLLSAAHELSLFSEKKLIELYLPTGKASDKGLALIHYCESLPPDIILLIITGKIEAASKRSRWYKAVDAVAGIINVWAIKGQGLHQWLQQRLKAKGLILQSDSLQLITDRVEGNLLAADQEIEKLSLLYPIDKQDSLLNLEYEQISDAIFDNARYNLFALFDCALAGNLKRSSRMLYGLQREDQAIILIIALFVKEVRLLAKMSAIFYCDGQANNTEIAMQNVYIYPKRKPLLAQALRTRQTSHWQQLLSQLFSADKMAKGALKGDPWGLMQLILAQLAGKPYLAIKINSL